MEHVQSHQVPVSAALRYGANLEWAEAHDTLRGELAAALTRFREECAPLVGPEVTARGVTVVPARRVPVAPWAYQLRVMREGFNLVRSQVAGAWGTLAATMSQAVDQVLQAWGPTQAAFALVDGDTNEQEEEDHA